MLKMLCKPFKKPPLPQVLHGKNYVLTSETYTISDMNLILIVEKPTVKSKIIYKNDLAKKDFRVQFKQDKETLDNY
jgi:hypothetical protein